MKLSFLHRNNWLIRGLFIGFILWTLGGITRSILNQEKFFKSLLSIPRLLINIHISDFVFIAAIAFIAWILFIFHRRFGGLSINKNKEMSAKIDQLRQHNSQIIEQMNSFFSDYKKLSSEDRALLDRVKPFIDQILKKGLIIKNNAYWIQSENGSISEGPFCIKCYSADGQLVPMLDIKTVYKCPVCDLTIKKDIGVLSEHELFILDFLLLKPDCNDTISNIQSAYYKIFENSGPNLNIVLNKLAKLNFIEEVDIGYKGIGYSLRSDGITYIGNIKEKEIKPK